jgi:hypothetical protein
MSCACMYVYMYLCVCVCVCVCVGVYVRESRSLAASGFLSLAVFRCQVLMCVACLPMWCVTCGCSSPPLSPIHTYTHTYTHTHIHTHKWRRTLHLSVQHPSLFGSMPPRGFGHRSPRRVVLHSLRSPLSRQTMRALHSLPSAPFIHRRMSASGEPQA